MVLPSQNARVSDRRSHMFRRRHLRRLPLIVLGVGAMLVAGWFISRQFGGDEITADPDQVAQVTDAGSEQPPRSANRSADPGEEDSAGESPKSTGAPDVGTQHETPSDGAISPDRDVASPQGASGGGLSENTIADIRARQMFNYGFELIGIERPVEARKVMTAALSSGRLNDVDELRLRVALNGLAEKLVFSPYVHPDDPFAMTYVIEPNDMLQKIVKANGLQVTWRFIQRINQIEDPTRIRPPQKIKLITGPFHAVVDKSDFRLDLYLGDGEDRVFVRSFGVGLGEFNATPTGLFHIGVKAINPDWTNPRTFEHFDRDDPKNPIGERWLALKGIDDNTRGYDGYGIHGTIEPDSIGREQSMGCIRMLPNEVAILYEALLSKVSTVEIRP